MRAIAVFLLGLMHLMGMGQPNYAADRPNIVWIIADDLSPELGCYGYAGVATPHLDRLAEQGLRYSQAFATAPVCSSSRSALITGVYQTTTGTHQHRTPHKMPLPRPFQPITELLRGVGYFVCNSDASMTRPGKTDYNFQFDGEMYDAPDWSQRRSGQPFFAQIQIHEPHRDFVSAETSRDPAQATIPEYYPEHPVIRRDWDNYLASIEVLDRKVGTVLKRLEQEGLDGNTAVFFFGDHGRPHYRDKQWLYEGGIRVPLIVRWPGRIGPKKVRGELVSLIDVSATTLCLAGVNVPVWMHGQNILQEGFPGRERIFAARDRCGNTLDRIRCVRTQRFKYIRNFYPDRPYTQQSGYKELQYPGMTVARVLHRRGALSGGAAAFWAPQRPAEELYDLAVDPAELHNLAMDPQHAPVLAGLRSELDEWIGRTTDRGSFAEADVQQTVESSRRWYESRMKKRGLAPDIDPESYLQWWEEELGLK